MACEAKGPDMNKKFCSAYTHTRGKNSDSDDDDEDQYPGTKTINEAYLRIVENHKDKVFQQNEDKETKKLNKLRKIQFPQGEEQQV
eukprot:15784903-Heterocapsa_arctica.AAC.1